MEAYPLHWPQGYPRTERKSDSKFKTSLSAALKNVNNSLQLFGSDSGKRVTDVIVSSNVTLGMQNPKESGVSIWFKWDDSTLCIAIDRYAKVEDNLQAIHHIIEARRTELRHGGLHIVRQTFRGFKALPESASKKEWHQVLGVDKTASEEQIKSSYKKKAKEVHPDVPGGSNALFQELQQAYEVALNIHK